MHKSSSTASHNSAAAGGGGGGGFWKPGQKAPSIIDQANEIKEFRDSIIDRNEENLQQEFIYNPHRRLSMDEQRKQLPIYKFRNSLLYLLENYNVLIVSAETASGKTTQIPQYLYESGWCSNGQAICCTQPRRISAISAAKRVFEEKRDSHAASSGPTTNQSIGISTRSGILTSDNAHTELGGLVGYCVQFDAKYSDFTKIKYMTDGMLLREMLVDPLLTDYSVIMVDEVHERSTKTDILLGLLKKVLQKRPELRLIVSSATLDAEDFYKFFNVPQLNLSCYIMSIEGRAYPVDIYYVQKPVSDYVRSSLQCVLNIHNSEPIDSGDVLVFLTGQQEIEELISLIEESLFDAQQQQDNMVLLPLYAGLSLEEQMKIFDTTTATNKNKRKVIVSTNIAETSITIPSLRFVVDCGFVKERIYDYRSNRDCLVVTEISKSSSRQRAGRAGRVMNGKCFRLYTEQDYEQLVENTIPEIQKSNLSDVILQMKALGIDNLVFFDFLSSPPSSHMAQSLETLYSLGALDDECQLTSPLGLQMAEFPTDPFVSKILLQSGRMNCTLEMLIICAMSSVRNVFVGSRQLQDRVEYAKRKFSVMEGDHLTHLNIYSSYLKNNKGSKWCYDNCINYKSMQRVEQFIHQYEKFLKRFSIPIKSIIMMDENRSIDSSSSPPTDIIRKCLISGYFANAAQRQSDGSYKSIRGTDIYYIHPNSILFKYPPEFVIFTELLFTTKVFMRDVTTIEPDWLVEMCPQLFERTIDRKEREIQERLHFLVRNEDDVE